MGNKGLEDNLCLRIAREKDMMQFYEWANDEAVRKSAFHSGYISLEEHKQWFTKMLHDADQLMFVLLDGNKPIGQVRVSVTGDVGEIDYSIDSGERGRGYGERIISLLLEMVIKNFKKIKRLEGKVKPDNFKSQKCFEYNGFKEQYRVYQLDIQEWE